MAAGEGMTSEQSTRSDGVWPSVASLDMTASNEDTIRAWSAVRAVSGNVCMERFERFAH